MTDPVSSEPMQPRERGGRARKPNLSSSDPYAVLGLPRRASTREIKRAYFDLVRQYSPESNPEAFKRIRSAYEKLRTDEAKAETDLFLFQPPPPWSARKRPRKFNLDFDPQDIWVLLQTYGDLGRREFKEDYRPVKV